jgi:hypothetical protein
MSERPAADEPGADATEEEVRRLRARVAELERERERPVVTKAPTRERWRTITATLLIVIGCLLAPLSVVSVWASNQVSDTDRYVATVSPLAEDPAIQAAITDQITAQIFSYVDVDQITSQTLDVLTRQGLAPQISAQLQALTSPLSSAIEGFTRTQVEKIVASPEFAKAWDEANRLAHDQLVALLEGDTSGALVATGDAVSLNLRPFIAQAKQTLVDNGFGIARNIPDVDKSFVLVKSDSIPKAQGAYRVLNTLGNWLPFVALGLIGIGVYVAKNRRRALMGAGLGVAASMAVLALGIAVGRVFYLDAIPAETLPADAAAAVYDALVSFLRLGLRAVLVAALIVAAGAFLSGGTDAAVAIRGGLTRGIARLRGQAESAGMNTGPVGAWVYTYSRWLRIGLVVVGGLALIFMASPTGKDVVVVTILVLVGVAIVEFVGKRPAAAVAPAASRGGDDDLHDTKVLERDS